MGVASPASDAPELLTRADISMVKVEPIDISVNSETRPVALPPRCPAFSIRKDVEAELKLLQEMDIKESVQGAAPWVSPGTSEES